MSVVLSDDTVTARVSHLCDICAGSVRPKEKYRLQRVAADGSVHLFKMCWPCYDLREVIFKWAAFADEGVGQDTYAEWANDVVRGYEPAEPVVYSQAIEFLARLRGGDR